jgi:light-regulated signal transduction histidine kinase (bacteriophytochrome)
MLLLVPFLCERNTSILIKCLTFKFVAPRVQPKVVILTEEKPEAFRLWVEDNGLGIKPEYHEKIFGVFERLHGIETYPGTGIGLAMVRKGVEPMVGKVGVVSVLGEGSSFWIELQRIIENK